MNPIYHTITGGIDATMEGGLLYRRGAVGLEKTPWKWEPMTQAWLENRLEQLGESHGIEWYRIRCLLACLRDENPSPWRHEFASVTIATKIEELEGQLQKAIADELADRPVHAKA